MYCPRLRGLWLMLFRSLNSCKMLQFISPFVVLLGPWKMHLGHAESVIVSVHLLSHSLPRSCWLTILWYSATWLRTWSWQLSLLIFLVIFSLAAEVAGWRFLKVLKLRRDLWNVFIPYFRWFCCLEVAPRIHIFSSKSPFMPSKASSLPWKK